MSRISPALRIAIMTGIAIVTLPGCDIQELLGLEEEEDTGESLITDPEAVAAMDVVGSLIEAILDGGGVPPEGQTFPDYDAGDYPTGISVTTTASSSSTVTLDVAIVDVVPEDDGVPYDETYDGSADIVLTDDAAASELTVEIDAAMTVSGTDALFSSMSVEGGAAVYTYSATTLDLSAVTAGTLTVDGTAYDMTRIDVGGGDDDTEGDSVSAADSHYFLMSYRIDTNGVGRPQIVYSENGSTWTTNPIHLNGVGRLQAGAVDDGGRIVAVGTQGYVYWSDNGSEWTMVGSASVTTQDLFAVEFANNVWIAAGNGVILQSTDGSEWTEAWTGGVEIHALMYDASETVWVAAGAPPDTGVFSTDNGSTWTTSYADEGNRPNQLVVELFATGDDTEWIALTGQPGSPGGIFDGTDLESDDDTDWVINSTGVTTEAYAVLAGAERDGVFVAMSQLNGTDVTMLVSSDAGDTWSAHDVSGLPGWPVDITAVGNGFMGVTNQGGVVRGSADGQTWLVIDDESYGSYGVVFKP